MVIDEHGRLNKRISPSFLQEVQRFYNLPTGLREEADSGIIQVFFLDNIHEVNPPMSY